MAALALEIKKLHGELANAEKRARAAVAAANPGDCFFSNFECLFPLSRHCFRDSVFDIMFEIDHR